MWLFVVVRCYCTCFPRVYSCTATAKHNWAVYNLLLSPHKINWNQLIQTDILWFHFELPLCKLSQRSFNRLGSFCFDILPMILLFTVNNLYKKEIPQFLNRAPKLCLLSHPRMQTNKQTCTHTCKHTNRRPRWAAAETVERKQIEESLWNVR